MIRAKILLLCAAFLLSSCTTTTGLFEDRQYSERIDSFFISEDREQLIVVGEKYHYIFPVDKPFGEFLASPERSEYAEHLNVTIESAKVDANNNASVHISVKNNSVTSTLRAKTIDGVEVYERKQVPTYSLTRDLLGKRYRAKERLPAEYRFNQTYVINVSESLSAAEVMARAPLTPVTMIIDAGKVIYAIGLLTFIMIVYDPSSD